MKDLIAYVQDQTQIPIRGHGTRGAHGEATPIDTGIINYKPAELYITAFTGTSMDEIHATLDGKGQRLACDPMEHNRLLGSNGAPSLGGAIAVNASGPARLRYGALRDAVLGLEFVDGRAQLIRAGGVVMKNVTGLDLVKFFVGSRGRLGIATTATLKVLPKPAEEQNLVFTLSATEYLERIGWLLRQPLDIIAAEWCDGRLYIKREGSELMQSKPLIEDRLGVAQEMDPAIWQYLRDQARFADSDELWRLFLRPSQCRNLIPKIDAQFQISMGGQQLFIADRRAGIEQYCHDGIFAICEKGNIGERLPALSPNQVALRQELSDVFDPNHKFRWDS